MDRIAQLMSSNQNVSTSYNFVAATDWSGSNRSTKITGVTGKRICVQKITLSVTTDNAATQALQSSAGTPVVVARSAASPGLGARVWDFGTEGYKLLTGESLVHEMSAAGMAGTVTIQAYMETVPNL